MKPISMALIAAGAILALSCSPAVYRYRAGILTPDTPEGNACRRECLALVGSCLYYRKGDTQVIIEAGPYSHRHGCPGIISDCLITCPGAIVDPDDPPRMIPVGWGYTDGGPHEFAD